MLPNSLYVTERDDAERRAAISILRLRSVRECTDDFSAACNTVIRITMHYIYRICTLLLKLLIYQLIDSFYQRILIFLKMTDQISISNNQLVIKQKDKLMLYDNIITTVA